MQPWIPPRHNPTRADAGGLRAEPEGLARPARRYIAQPTTLAASQIDGKDIAFCSELAFHGGSRAAPEGFANERELLRLHEAGLLDLHRQEEQPFMIVKMSLSAAARRLVGADGEAGGAMRRQGFEVARAMIGVAAKSEIAAWRAAGGSGGVAALEQRVMTRILSIDAPFQ